jgi:type VI secretion system protein ImpB
MQDSFQHEIPKARVNITLDIETGEGRKKKELPMKLLVIGDFSNGQTNGPIAQRERINIGKNNFDQVLKELKPNLNFTVPNRIKNNNSELKVNIKLNSLRDFHPEELVKQLPELRNLLAMRNLLKDLKANVIDNATFRQELEKIIHDETNLQQLRQQLNQLLPTNSSN